MSVALFGIEFPRSVSDIVCFESPAIAASCSCDSPM